METGGPDAPTPEPEPTPTPTPGPTPDPADGGGAPSQEDKTNAMLCWLLGIVLWIISPVIFMIVGKEKPFVYRNSMQHMAFQIIMLVLWIVAGVLGTVIGMVTCGIGFIIWWLPGILNIVICVLGAVAANNGQVYEPPLTGSLAKSWFKV